MANDKPRYYIYGMLLFTLIVVGGITLIQAFSSERTDYIPDQEEFEQFNSTFSHLDALNNSIGGMRSEITSSDLTLGLDLGVLDDLLFTGWNTMKLLFSTFGFMDTAIQGLTAMFGVPGWIITIILALITTMIMFSIFSAIFQRDL